MREFCVYNLYNKVKGLGSRDCLSQFNSILFEKWK